MLDDLTIQFFPLWLATPRVGGSANQKSFLCGTTRRTAELDPPHSRATPHSVARVPSRVAATVHPTASHTHHLRDNPRCPHLRSSNLSCAPAARRRGREGAIETLHRPVFRVSADGPGTPPEVVQGPSRVSRALAFPIARKLSQPGRGTTRMCRRQNLPGGSSREL